MTTTLAYLLSAVALIAAVAVVLTKDVMRLILALGTVLVAVAGLFGVLGATFVSVAEIFVYVGGVLVLFLFAIMLVHRSDAERPELTSRHDLLSMVIGLGAFLMIVTTFAPAVRSTPVVAIIPSMRALGRVLTGPLLPHFEAAGVLLLAALVAVITIMAGERR